MSRKKKKRVATEQPVSPLPQESRRAEIATVVWMLTALLALVSEILHLAARAYLSLLPGVLDANPLQLLPGITWLTSLVAGLCCLFLTPLVYRWRKAKPPRVITLIAILVSILPMAVGITQSLFR